MAATKEPPIAEEIHEPLVESLPHDTRDSQVYSPVVPQSHALDDHHHDMFADHHDDRGEPAKPRLREQKTVKGGWTWLVLGLCLHLSAVGAIAAYFMKLGPFADSPTTHEEIKIQKNKGKR